MNRVIYWVLLAVLIVPVNCSAKDKSVVNAEKVKKLIDHYFTDARIGDDRTPYFLEGDFNGDGLSDLAVLFYPQDTIKPSKQLQLIQPWTFEGSQQSKKYHKSLSIIHGHPDGWLSSNTKVFALLDKTGSLETPSFQLMVKKASEINADNIPIKSKGDIIVLPTEAGIDTYVYWEQHIYKLHIPEEIP